MTSRYATLAFFAACSLLFAGPVGATGTHPASRPAPTRRVPAAPRPAPAPVATVAAPEAEATPRSVSVAGTIVGADGKPCPGACVFPTNNPRLIAVTDATGAFHLEVPATAGSINLQADYFGVGSRRVVVNGQHPQPINIVLGL